jgi:hypothetical protein
MRDPSISRVALSSTVRSPLLVSPSNPEEIGGGAGDIFTLNRVFGGGVPRGTITLLDYAHHSGNARNNPF